MSWRKLLDEKMSKHTFKTFGKDERSSFKYWYYHWKAFNLTAFYIKAWKFKYLFHDIEKPWLKLMWGDYKRVQQWHRLHNKHHSEYKGGYDKIDWEALIIDNECSRFTKASAQLNARDYIQYVISDDCNKPAKLKYYYKNVAIPFLDYLGL